MQIALLIFGCVLVAGSTAARADVASAREHFQKGRVLYDLQRYLEAAKEYELAYEAKDDPALLFNIGQSYRLGGENAKALGAYRSYLRNVPDAPNRREIEARIVDLQRLLDEQRKSRETQPQSSAPLIAPPPVQQPAPQAPVAVPPTPAAPQAGPSDLARARRAHTMRIAGIAVGAFGVVALGGGIALELVAKADNDKFAHPTKGTVFDPGLESAVKNDQAAGIALMAVGAAAIATGATLVGLGLRERRKSQLAFAPTFAPGFAGAAFSRSF